MFDAEANQPLGPNPARFSYWFMLGCLALLVMFHLFHIQDLATPLLVTLFAYLALTKLHFFKRASRIVAVGLFLVLLAGVIYVSGHFVRQTVRTLPEIADKAIPKVIDWAKKYQVELPFTDYDSLKELAITTVKKQSHYLGNVARFARGASTQLVFVIVAVVVAISIFLNRRMELEGERYSVRNNLYSLCCDEVAQRFRTLYQSFATVIGAQVVISAINTTLTGIFVLVVGLPHALVVVGVTFFCGLVPVLGNLISNTVIVAIGFTVSPEMALTALAFLIIIHKLEYFLNSKIIGQRIRNPLWLTLVALVLGERLLGLSGMVLAPVLLNYIRMEASRIAVKPQLDRELSQV